LHRSAFPACGRARCEAALVCESANSECKNLAIPTTPIARASRFLYYCAELNLLLGRRAKVAELCRRSVARSDYTKAYQLLAELELAGDNYLELLGRIHEHLKPETYIEVGVAWGDSLQLVRPETRALAIDPEPLLKITPAPAHTVFRERSDDFFARHDVSAALGGRPLRMAFIDGMHQFEFALRDFINLERLSEPNSLIFVHDVFPLDARTAARERETRFWSGDIWRLIVLLKKHRPDLAVYTLAAPPTGLGLITRLDPQSRTLAGQLPELIREGLSTEFRSIAERKAEALNLKAGDWPSVRRLIDERY